jgi:pimeloyl-ACP methyl ester carboxylesterase
MSQAKRSKLLLKDTLKKQKKLLIILSAVLILLVIGYFTLGLQVKFILEEEMDLDLVPAEDSFTVPYTDSAQVNFTLRVDNPSVCSFTCDHEFIDISTGETLDSRTTRQHEVTSSYDLSIDEVGEGQHIYSYQVVCHNIKSNFCSTTEKNYFKSSLITVNYELPPEEQVAKEQTEQELIAVLSRTAELEAQLNYAKDIASVLGVNTSANQLSATIASLILPLEELWEAQLFSSLQQEFTPEFNASLQNLELEVQEEVLRLTTLLADVEAASLQLQNLTNATTLSAQATLFAQTNYASTFDAFLIALNETANEYENATFNSETGYLAFINEVAALQNLYLEVQEQARFQQTSREAILNTTLIAQQEIYDAFAINRTVPLALSCQSIEQENIFVQARAAQVATQRANYPFSSSFFDSLSLDVLSGTVNWSVYDVEVNGTNYTFSNLTLAQLSPVLAVPEIIVPFCNASDVIVNISMFTPFEFPELQLLESAQVTLDMHEPICCYDGDCTACCTDSTCEDTYPVIFVHGHALSEANSPEESHSAFGVIQRLLEEEGYVNAGQLGTDSAFSIPAGDWGRVDAPISIRISYYLITYVDVGTYQVRSQKTDKIENYAIRLKDLIDTIKFRTGKDKVDIVAHSMGGLVTREYIALFGEDSVNKFVMVGTPNYGVEGRVNRLCSLTGASRECEDMDADSIFLKRLNTPQNAFETIDGYTIRAIGCDMEGEDGDGIVLARNVPLPYTTNYVVEGECTDSLNSNLHTRFLNPNEHRETYELIRSILLR